MASQTDPLLLHIRQRLQTAANETDRAAIRRFFRETVTPCGVKATLVHELTRYALPILRERTPAARNRFFEALWKSGLYEEGMLAVYLARRFTRDCGPCEFKLWERWIDRYATNWAHCDGISMHLIGSAIAQHPELAVQLEAWTASPNPWKRRSAAASLVREARQGRHAGLTGRILERLEGDPASLIRKAVVWLRRERGKAPLTRARR